MATNKNLSTIDEKFQKDKLSFNLVTNDNLICKDCRNCVKYEVKPDEVLDGGECVEYDVEYDKE